jgi:hypothetical protein
MASVDLVFEQPSASDAHLLFGWTVAPLAIEATFQGTLPALSFAARAIPNAGLALVAVLPALAMGAEGRYQSYTARPTVGQTAADWQVTMAFEAGAQPRHQAATPDRAPGGSRWTAAEPRTTGIEARRAGRLMGFPIRSRIAHQEAGRASAGERRARHEEAIRLRTVRASRYEAAQRAEWARREVRHQDGLRDRRHGAATGYEEAMRLAGARQGEAMRGAVAQRFGFWPRWQTALVPPPGISLWIIPEPPAPPPCYTPSPQLRFANRAAASGHLLFRCAGAGAPIAVPIRRVYYVLNDVTLHRVPDGAEVPAFSLALSLDAGSWAWGFEAGLPATALPLVEPEDGPVELLARVNGAEFRLLAEDISRERQFGQASIRVSGRGRNAVLAAPYAPVMTFANTQARTARQLMDDVLTLNGVPLGWTVDWGLTDWTVPAGVFAHQGTWIEALIAIANAAGGYLIPHPSALSLKVRHRYPVAPWEWDTVTPDVVLPAEAVSRESLRWLEKPAYNRVFVAGQETGVLGQVTRAGTAGDLLAPMVVDPLITEAAAARQRGLAILADTGRQIEVTLRLPVLAETGILEPGLFVEYQDGTVARLGFIRSTSVQVTGPEVWQTVGVQTYG